MPAQPSGAKSQSSTISTSLLERVQDNDDAAWDRIVHLYGQLVYRLCRVKHIPPEDAKDVVQEVFRAAHRKIKDFRRNRPGDSFHGWLLTITRSKISDYYRRLEKNPQAAGGTDMQVLLQRVEEIGWEDSDDKSSTIDAVTHVVRRAVQTVRGEVEPATWDAFWETRIERRTTDDVAQELHKSKCAVYQASSRVARRLREELKGLFDESSADST